MASPVDIIGGFYTVDGLDWACQDTVNYLPRSAEVAGSKTQTTLVTPPGLRPWVNIGDGPSRSIRGMHDAEGRLFVVSGQMLYQISNKGVALPLGAIPGVGRVSMAHNQISGGNELLVVNGTSGYVWNTLKRTFRRVTDPGYPGASHVDFINGYMMQVEPFGRFMFFSDLADAMSYNTLDRFEAESAPDKIVGSIVDHDEVWVFGERTTQVFQNTGAAQGTFQSKGIVIEQGCAGRDTIAKIDNSVCWLGNDGIVYRADGYTPVRISTHAIEHAISGNNWSAAFAFTWSSRGHKVYYLTFPDGQTWGFDLATRIWHRRASYHPVHEVARRWRLNALVYSNGQWIAGDSASGRLYVLDWDYMLEGESAPLVSERVTAIAANNAARFVVDLAELDMRTGEKSTSPQVFPIQPAGPKISGSAPSGGIWFAYPGYTYSITEGDSEIKSIEIVDGDLPAGLSFVDGVISSGIPESSGDFSITIRVTDSNDLWVDHVDTVKISPVLFLLLSSSQEGIWISPDMTQWSARYAFIPSVSSSVRNAEVTQGKLAIDAIAGSNTEKFLQAPLPPWSGHVPIESVSEIRTVTGIIPSNMHDYGGVLVAWEGNRNYPHYYVSSDGGETYEQVPVPNSWRVSGISRMASGRWIAGFQYGSSNAAFYTDEEVPKNWIQSASGIVGSDSDCFVADEFGYQINNSGMCRRTSDGIIWTHVGTVTGSPKKPFLTSKGSLLVYGQNAYGLTRRSADRGETWQEVRFAASGDIEKITEAGGVIVASGNGVFFSSTDDGLTWTSHPSPISGSTTAVAIDVSGGMP